MKGDGDCMTELDPMTGWAPSAGPGPVPLVSPKINHNPERVMTLTPRSAPCIPRAFARLSMRLHMKSGLVTLTWPTTPAGATTQNEKITKRIRPVAFKLAFRAR